VENSSSRSSFESRKAVELAQNELTRISYSWEHKEETEWTKSMSWKRLTWSGRIWIGTNLKRVGVKP